MSTGFPGSFGFLFSKQEDIFSPRNKNIFTDLHGSVKISRAHISQMTIDENVLKRFHSFESQF